MRKFLLLLALAMGLGLTACSDFFFDDEFESLEIFVPDDIPTIQAAIDFAYPGDQVLVRCGVYSPSSNGELFPIFMQDGVDVVGEDRDCTILDAEGTDYVMDLFGYDFGLIANFTVTGGLAPAGAGIVIEDSRGWISNLRVVGNRAEEVGSGIFVTRSNGFLLENTIVENNFRRFVNDFDPAQVEVEDSFLLFYNNTVALGDADGMLVYEFADGDFQNNIFYENGSDGFGVGFADLNEFTNSVIQYNICFGNEEADFFLDGDLRTAAEANALASNIDFNFNADPLFVNPGAGDFNLLSGSPAIHAGNPDDAFDNPDGSRNTIGDTGGPGAGGPL